MKFKTYVPEYLRQVFDPEVYDLTSLEDLLNLPYVKSYKKNLGSNDDFIFYRLSHYTHRKFNHIYLVAEYNKGNDVFHVGKIVDIPDNLRIALPLYKDRPR